MKQRLNAVFRITQRNVIALCTNFFAFFRCITLFQIEKLFFPRNRALCWRAQDLNRLHGCNFVASQMIDKNKRNKSKSRWNTQRQKWPAFAWLFLSYILYNVNKTMNKSHLLTPLTIRRRIIDDKMRKWNDKMEFWGNENETTHFHSFSIN